MYEYIEVCTKKKQQKNNGVQKRQWTFKCLSIGHLSFRYLGHLIDFFYLWTIERKSEFIFGQLSETRLKLWIFQQKLTTIEPRQD